MCFGLTDAPGTFQNIMNDVLEDVIGKYVLVYLYDIVIFSRCKFVQPELHFVCLVVGVQALPLDPKKIFHCTRPLQCM